MSSDSDVYVVDSSSAGGDDFNDWEDSHTPAEGSELTEGTSTSINPQDTAMVPMQVAVPKIDVGLSTEVCVSYPLDESLQQNLMRLSQAVAPDIQLVTSRAAAKRERPQWVTTLSNIKRMRHNTSDTSIAREEDLAAPTSMADMPPPEWLPRLTTVLNETSDLVQGSSLTSDDTSRAVQYLLESDRADCLDLAPSDGTVKRNKVSAYVADEENELTDGSSHLSELHLVLNAEGVDSLLPLYAELQDLRERQKKRAHAISEETKASLCSEETLLARMLAYCEREEHAAHVQFRSDCTVSPGNSIHALQETLQRLEEVKESLERVRLLGVASTGTLTTNSHAPHIRSGGKAADVFRTTLQLERDALAEETQLLKSQLLSLREEHTRLQEQYEKCQEQSLQVSDTNGFVRKEVLQQMHLQRKSLLTSTVATFGWTLIDSTGEVLHIVNSKTGEHLHICLAQQPATINSQSVDDVAAALAGHIVESRVPSTGAPDCGSGAAATQPSETNTDPAADNVAVPIAAQLESATPEGSDI